MPRISKAARIAALRDAVLAAFIPSLPLKGEEHEYSFRDPETERSFEVLRFEALNEQFQPEIRFFLSEQVPNGRACETNKSGHVIHAWDLPGFKAMVASVGPNGLMGELRASGVDTDTLVSEGGGFGIDSVYHASLDMCAQEIAQAIVANKWYRSFKPLTKQEKVKQDRKSAVQSHEYWNSQRQTMDAAQASEEGIFKGCSNGLGERLSEETKHKILAYLNAPSQEKWLDVRGLIITGAGTLWQAWCAHDDDAPRAGSIGYPQKQMLLEAIRTAVAQRDAEIARRLSKTTPSGLRAV